MASDTVHVGQLICDSTTPPPDRGFYKINDTTTGHVGKLVMSDPVSGKESVALTATLSDGGNEISIGPVARRQISTAETSVTAQAAKRAALMNDLKKWVYPTHTAILDPRRYAGMNPITSGVLTCSQ